MGGLGEILVLMDDLEFLCLEKGGLASALVSEGAGVHVWEFALVASEFIRLIVFIVGFRKVGCQNSQIAGHFYRIEEASRGREVERGWVELTHRHTHVFFHTRHI